MASKVIGGSQTRETETNPFFFSTFSFFAAFGSVRLLVNLDDEPGRALLTNGPPFQLPRAPPRGCLPLLKAVTTFLGGRFFAP